MPLIIALNSSMDRRIAVIYGRNISDMTRKLLDAFSLPSLIGDSDSRIVIKPNLVTVSDPDEGATTHTEIVEATVQYLQEHGFTDLTVAEGSWVGASTEECLRRLGYYRLRDRYGIKLVDTKKDSYRKVSPDGIAMEISETFLSAGFIINIPVLKGHCQTMMTHAMKNLKGCLSDKSKREFHRLGLDRPIAALSTVIRPGLTISDGICGDLDFEEGGNPVETDRMMAAADPVLLDAYAATLMGFSPESIGYIREARNLGLIRSYDWEIEELSKPVAAAAGPSGAVRRLSCHTAPDDACSACYASLIHALKRLDDEGALGKLGKRKIAIGQGYRGKSPEIGVGSCCSRDWARWPACCLSGLLPRCLH